MCLYASVTPAWDCQGVGGDTSGAAACTGVGCAASELTGLAVVETAGLAVGEAISEAMIKDVRT